ncbi:MAG: hypothetical protein Q9190_008016 [Brigantiaea leucoxantha]
MYGPPYGPSEYEDYLDPYDAESMYEADLPPRRGARTGRGGQGRDRRQERGPPRPHGGPGGPGRRRQGGRRPGGRPTPGRMGMGGMSGYGGPSEIGDDEDSLDGMGMPPPEMMERMGMGPMGPPPGRGGMGRDPRMGLDPRTGLDPRMRLDPRMAMAMGGGDYGSSDEDDLLEGLGGGMMDPRRMPPPGRRGIGMDPRTGLGRRPPRPRHRFDLPHASDDDSLSYDLSEDESDLEDLDSEFGELHGGGRMGGGRGRREEESDW